MHQSETQNPQETISMEEYLYRRKAIRENEMRSGSGISNTRATWLDVALEMAELGFS